MVVGEITDCNMQEFHNKSIEGDESAGRNMAAEIMDWASSFRRQHCHMRTKDLLEIRAWKGALGPLMPGLRDDQFIFEGLHK